MKATLLLLSVVMATLLLVGCASTTQETVTVGDEDSPAQPEEAAEPQETETAPTEEESVPTEEESAPAETEQAAPAESEAAAEDEGEVKTFVMGGENFKFTMDGEDNPTLRVNQGDTVRIEFTSISGFHDWVVDEFDASSERVRDGESTVVEFVADEAGTFDYYCSVGSHRASGMEGQLVVE